MTGRLHTDYLGDPACSICHGDGWIPAPGGLRRCQCLLDRLAADRITRDEEQAELTAYQAELDVARAREVALIESLVRRRLAIERGERPSVLGPADWRPDRPGESTVDPDDQYL